jgi:hypothetical protein
MMPPVCTCPRDMVRKPALGSRWPGSVNPAPRSGYYWVRFWEAVYCDAHKYVGYQPGSHWLLAEWLESIGTLRVIGSPEEINFTQVHTWGPKVVPPPGFPKRR